MVGREEERASPRAALTSRVLARGHSSTEQRGDRRSLTLDQHRLVHKDSIPKRSVASSRSLPARPSRTIPSPLARPTRRRPPPASTPPSSVVSNVPILSTTWPNHPHRRMVGRTRWRRLRRRVVWRGLRRRAFVMGGQRTDNRYSGTCFYLLGCHRGQIGESCGLPGLARPLAHHRRGKEQEADLCLFLSPSSRNACCSPPTPPAQRMELPRRAVKAWSRSAARGLSAAGECRSEGIDGWDR